MKRVIASLVFAVMAVAALSVPALADETRTSTSLTQPDQCVTIGLPILSKGNGTCNGGPGVSNDPKQGGAILIYLRDILQLLTGIVGIVIITMIILAGVQYITSAGDPGAIKSAKGRLMNAFIALALFLVMFAALQFLVPGGLFS